VEYFFNGTQVELTPAARVRDDLAARLRAFDTSGDGVLSWSEMQELCLAVDAHKMHFQCIESTATGCKLSVGFPELDYKDGTFWIYYSDRGELIELTLTNAQMSVEGLAGFWPSISDPSSTRGLFEVGVGLMKALEVDFAMNVMAYSAAGVTNQQKSTVYWYMLLLLRARTHMFIYDYCISSYFSQV